MKKLFLLITLFAFVGMASAQFTTGVKLTQTTSDTIKTGALTVTKYITITSGYNTLAIQPVVTKTSGTVAGKIYIAGTIDGTNYITQDSLVLSNVATNTKIYISQPAKFWKYKIWGVGTGTMNALLSVWYLARKTITE